MSITSDFRFLRHLLRRCYRGLVLFEAQLYSNQMSGISLPYDFLRLIDNTFKLSFEVNGDDGCGFLRIHTYIAHIHTYTHKSCSAPFTMKTRPTVHFSVISTEVKQ